MTKLMTNLTDTDIQNIRCAIASEIVSMQERGHYASAYDSMLTYNKLSPSMKFTAIDLEEAREAAGLNAKE